ncbi:MULTISPECIES: hypothetical protein [Flavobacterium]|uniref:DKNYY family protein n=1 Tax=Flavobacterium jumunjinense TaxID=998845 RepID=A0ABV5GU97_9FLAO|nr:MULTISPECIES: hypothetical protein [Flavobacterium]
MLRNSSLLLIILNFTIFSCNHATSPKETSSINKNSEFTLQQDTIQVNIRGEMTHALKFQDKYYVLFKQRVLKYGGHGKRWLCILSNGQVHKVIDCPKEINATYLDFYVKNDSIILKPYMDNKSYHFDSKKYSWNEVNETDDLIFEDEYFYVYSLDFGEWGGKTWFKDKKTQNEYVLERTTPLINKMGTTYYLSNAYEVLKIENPIALSKCDIDVRYENIENSKKKYTWYSEPVGFEIIYKDKDVNHFDYSYKPYIVSSFVVNNELLHIYESDSSAYVARIKNNKIEPIEKIIPNVSFYNMHFSYRCRNLNSKNELLKFETDKYNIFGLMEIVDTKILTTYFVNEAELKPKAMGAEKANEIFKNRLKIFLSDFENLTLSSIDDKEQTWKTFDITPAHLIGIDDKWNPNNFTIDQNRSYLIREDSIISNEIMYYGSKESDLIRVVSLNWEETNSSALEVDKIAAETFESKYEILEAIISQELGLPTIKNKKKYPTITWKTSNGLIVELSKAVNKKTNYYYLGLVIYRDKL